jgi:hypothetical protein
VLQS